MAAGCKCAFLAKYTAQKAQPQVPFDYAQGRFSTPFAAKNAAFFAQDASLLF
jgi:hypothetical protein